MSLIFLNKNGVLCPYVSNVKGRIQLYIVLVVVFRYSKHLRRVTELSFLYYLCPTSYAIASATCTCSL